MTMVLRKIEKINAGLKLPIQWKMALGGLVIITALLVLVTWFILPGAQKALFAEKENVIWSNVNTAWSIIDSFYQMQQDNLMTESRARWLAVKQIEKFRYGEDNSGYFWISDQNAYVVMDPLNSEMNGTDQSGYTDPTGKAIFVEMADVAGQNGEGVVGYLWQYGDDPGRFEEKSAYVKSFEPWGWVIGTGVYPVDLERAAVAMRNKYLIIGSAIAVLCLAFIFVYSSVVAKNVKRAVAITDKLALGDTYQKVKIESGDETGKMGNSLENLITYLFGMAQYSERIAQGDLTFNVEPKSTKDTLGNSFARMVTNLRELVEKVGTNAESINSASTQLSEASEQSGSATDQIASVAQQIAKGAEEQTRGINIVNTAISELAKAIELVNTGSIKQTSTVDEAVEIAKQVSSAADLTATSAQEAATNALQASEVAKQGSQSVEKTIEDIRKISNSMKNVANKAGELGKHSEEIGGMIAIIDDIASQTNLLALNAAIEAARAGEQGRGFAVVADEVKKLAERTAKETKEISSLVTLVQKGVKESIEASEEGAKQADESTDMANEAGTALIQILDAINKMNEQISGISAAAEEMSAFAQDVVKAVKAVSDIAKQNLDATRNMSENEAKVRESAETVAATIEENSASTQQMSASAEEMSAQVQQLVASSKTLSHMAQELKQATSRFKLAKSHESAEGGEAEEGSRRAFAARA